MDSKKRSIYKTISWHIMHVLMVLFISLIVTGNIKFAATIASIEMLFESFLFFGHERVWSKFGKNIR